MSDPTAFNSLLQRLSADGMPAELAYERLRFRLITFLRWRLPCEADTEALADAALDRLARRIHEGTAVHSVPQYALGIARLLVREAKGRLLLEQRVQASVAYERTITSTDRSHAALNDDGPHESEMTALSACLQGLDREERSLVLAYYGGDGAARIARRQELAAQLGISLNALRNRALRLRMRLEACVTARLRSRSTEPVMHPTHSSPAVAEPRGRTR